MLELWLGQTVVCSAEAVASPPSSCQRPAPGVRRSSPLNSALAQPLAAATRRAGGRRLRQSARDSASPLSHHHSPSPSPQSQYVHLAGVFPLGSPPAPPLPNPGPLQPPATSRPLPPPTAGCSPPLLSTRRLVSWLPNAWSAGYPTPCRWLDLDDDGDDSEVLDELLATNDEEETRGALEGGNAVAVGGVAEAAWRAVLQRRRVGHSRWCWFTMLPSLRTFRLSSCSLPSSSVPAGSEESPVPVPAPSPSPIQAPASAAIGGGASASGSSGKVKRVMKTPYQLEVLERTYIDAYGENQAKLIVEICSHGFQLAQDQFGFPVGHGSALPCHREMAFTYSGFQLVMEVHYPVTGKRLIRDPWAKYFSLAMDHARAPVLNAFYVFYFVVRPIDDEISYSSGKEAAYRKQYFKC
ncbi:hypothetical protein ABZP36_001718 [Zizania latifolia]